MSYRTCFIHDGAFTDDGDLEELISSVLDMVGEDQESPITIVINSGGGNFYRMVAIIDLLTALPCPVYTQVLGMAGSAAAALAAIGNKGHRWISPNSDMMLHLPRTTAEEMDTVDIKGLAKNMGEITDRYMGMLVHSIGENTPARRKKLRADIDRDLWMNAEEAVKYGVVDNVGICPSLLEENDDDIPGCTISHCHVGKDVPALDETQRDMD